MINFWENQSLPSIGGRKGCPRGEVGGEGGWPTSSCLVFLLSQALTSYTQNAQLSALFWCISPHFRHPHLSLTLWLLPALAEQENPCLWMGLWCLLGTMGSEGHFLAAAYGYGPCSISWFDKPKHPLSWDLRNLCLAFGKKDAREKCS